MASHHNDVSPQLTTPHHYLSSMFQLPRDGTTFISASSHHSTSAMKPTPMMEGALGQLMKLSERLSQTTPLDPASCFKTAERLQEAPSFSTIAPTIAPSQISASQSISASGNEFNLIAVPPQSTFFDPLIPFSHYTMAATTFSGANKTTSSGIRNWPSNSFWPWSSSTESALQNPTTNALLSVCEAAVSPTAAPAYNASAYFEPSSFKGLTAAPSTPSIACFGQHTQNAFNDFYYNTIGNPLHLTIGSDELNPSPSESSSTNSQKTSSLTASMHEKITSQEKQQLQHHLQRISSSSTYSASSSSMIVNPSGLISSSFVKNSQVSENNKNEPSWKLQDSRSQKATNKLGGGGKSKSTRQKPTKEAKPISAASKDAAAASNCGCSNCREISELERRGLPICNKKRVHKCDIPGCFKVYQKSSHLKAHQRWHAPRQLVVQKRRRLFDPPADGGAVAKAIAAVALPKSTHSIPPMSKEFGSIKQGRIGKGPINTAKKNN